MTVAPKSSVIDTNLRVNDAPVSASNPLPITGGTVADVEVAGAVSIAAPSYPDGTVQPFSLDTSGNLRVAGTFPTAPPSYATTAAPSYTNATYNPLSLDLAGNLRTIISGALAAGSNTIGGVKLVDTGGTNIASISAAGALKVDGSAVTQPVSGTFWPTTQPVSGTVTANAGANLNTSALALESGGNLATVASAQGTSGTGIVQPTGGAGILGWLSGIFNKLNTSIAVTGTFWQTTQPVSGSVSVSNFPATQPISAASLPLPSGASTAANQTLVQGSVAAGTAATSSQLAGAVYNTTAPAPTNGQQMALQTDSAGRLQVNTVIDATTSNATISSATTGATLDTTGYASAVFQITSIGGANTVVFEGSNDNATWLSTPVLRADTTSATPVTSMTTTGAVVAPARFKYIRWRASVYASGNITVYSSLRTANEAQPGMAVDGSAVTQPASVADGSNVTQGAKADAAYAGSGSASVVAALKGIYAALVGAQPAGSNLIGKVGIDQTTPGTTNGVQVNAALPAGTNKIGVVQQSGTLTDRSGTVATGGTSQALAASNASRKYLFIENPPSATENLFINFTSNASTSAAGSLSLTPGGVFIMESEFVSTEAVNVTAATTSHAYIAKEG